VILTPPFYQFAKRSFPGVKISERKLKISSQEQNLPLYQNKMTLLIDGGFWNIPPCAFAVSDLNNYEINIEINLPPVKLKFRLPLSKD
jgi:hypothetical protein